MSNIGPAQKAIFALLAAAWGERTPIAWPNVNFTPPDPDAGPAEWIKVDLLWGAAEAMTMGLPGSGRARNTIVGVLQVAVFAPRNTAGAVLMAHGDAVRDAVNRVEVNGVRFGVPSAPQPGDDSRWEMRTVSCGFTVDEVI